MTHQYSKCEHARSIDGSETYLLECAIGTAAKGSHFTICEFCADYDGPDRGLGDRIKRAVSPIAKAVGLAKCGGCQKRRAKLNQQFPAADSPA